MKSYSNLDLQLNQLINAVAEKVSTNPTASTAYKGRFIFNTTDNMLYYCDGTSWVPITANIDTKVTTVGNHYTPSGTTVPTKNNATTPTGDTVQVVCQVKGDAAGHVVSQDTVNVPTKEYIDGLILDLGSALNFKGTIGKSGATVTALPNSHKVGDCYLTKTAGTYAGQSCEVGDMIICITTGTAANNSDWTAVQANWTVATGTSTLVWGTEVTLATIGGVSIGAKLPSNPNTHSSHTISVANGDAASVPSGTEITYVESGAGGTASTENLPLTLTRKKITVPDVSGKADKSATVSTVTYDITNKKLTKTINGSSTDVVTVAKIVTDGGGITSHQSLDGYVNDLTVSGSGKFVTGVSKSGKTITVTKGNVTYRMPHIYTSSVISGKSGTIEQVTHNLSNIQDAYAICDGRKVLLDIVIDFAHRSVTWNADTSIASSLGIQIVILGSTTSNL
ncbi:MAG: hypothetical protein ACTTJH_00620 [Bacteroidales bacterium]